MIDPVLHPAALTKAGVEKDTIVISCKDTGKRNLFLLMIF